MKIKFRYRNTGPTFALRGFHLVGLIGIFLLLVVDVSGLKSRRYTDVSRSAFSEYEDGRRMFKNPRNAPSEECPRDEDAAHRMGRTCLRKCSSDSDCLSRKKLCLCDGICGMSCIKPDKECGELVNPMFGFVEVNGRVVGSKAKYKCQKVYHLIGSEERICQADGTWSRTPPECKENLYCTEPPVIAHAKHDAHKGQSRFNVNHTLQYTCEEGYSTRGFTAAKCFLYNGTMQWFGPEIECIPNACDDPGEIVNGFKEGPCFAYSCKVTYYCLPGYELVGRSEYTCQHDGTWMPRELPTCKGVPRGHFKDVQCEIPENPVNGRVIYTTVSYNSVITYECDHGYMIVGSATRRCGPNQKWSGNKPECKEINCGRPGNLPNGWIENLDQGQGLGSTVMFRCFPNTTLQGDHSATCQSDGTWSRPLPKCLAPCIVPTIENGIVNNTEPGEKVDHGFELNVICDDTFELSLSISPPSCHNGTWSLYPRCRPARCKELPVRPRFGMVIVPSSDHGMSAKFRCKDGYELEGNDTTECRFGIWTRKTPNCVEVYCPFPGTMDHGQVLLVGNMGMYDYRAYIQKVQNNRQIQYVCEKGFYLDNGPPGSTCVAGRWSPDKLPECKPDLHPRIQLRRKRRSIYQMDSAEEIDRIFRRRQNSSVETPHIERYENDDNNIGVEEYKEEHGNDEHTDDSKKENYNDNEEENSGDGKEGNDNNEDNYEKEDNEHEENERKIDTQKEDMEENEDREVRAQAERRKLVPLVLGSNRLFIRGSDHLDSSEEDIDIEDRHSRVPRNAFNKEERRRLRLERREQRRRLRQKRKGPRTKRVFARCEEMTEEPYMRVEILRAGRDANYTFSSGARIKVTCLHGYGLNIGNKTAKCARGKWKPMKPGCFNLPCTIPETNHGEFTYNSQPVTNDATISHGEVVKFSCEPGYNVLGSDTMRCWYGEWAVTGKNPECHPKSCILPDIQNGHYESGYKENFSVIHGALVTYTCDTGWVKGAMDVKCHTGYLMPSPPTCITPIALTTPPPSPPTLPTLPAVPLNLEQPQAIMAKKQDLVTDPNPDGRTYQDSSGDKNSKSPSSTNCDPPPKVPNTFTYKDGRLLESADKHFPRGTNITIRCVLLTKTTQGENDEDWMITCDNGQWNGTVGTCENGDDGIYGHKSCVWKKGDENVISHYNDQEITDSALELPPGAVVYSRCTDIGKYQMTGGIFRKCKHGVWTGETPVCNGLSQLYNYALDKPPTILIRHYRGPIAQNNEGRLVVYPATTLHLECLWVRKFGTPRWNISQTVVEEDPRKKKKKKKKRPKGVKGKGGTGEGIERKHPEGWATDPSRNRQLEYRLSLYKAKKDDSGTYICATPTMTQHSITVDVEAVHCPNIIKTAGLHLDPDSTKLSTEVKFNCDPGSMLVGPTEIRCKPSGNWSAPIPHCEKVRCGPPPAPKNGSVEGEGPFQAGDMVQISCHPNFMMDGPPMIVCQQDGIWSTDGPKCVEACTYPGTIISGMMSSVKFYYAIGDKITYTCSEGFVLHGARQIECLDGARWSGVVPTCLP